MAVVDGLDHIGTYKVILVTPRPGGRSTRRLVEVELQADLGALAGSMALTATRSRARPKQARIANGRIVATVTKETPVTL